MARNEPRLKALSGRLTKETGHSITALRADLSKKADLAKVESMLRDDEAITMLVNNAGLNQLDSCFITTLYSRRAETVWPLCPLATL